MAHYSFAAFGTPLDPKAPIKAKLKAPIKAKLCLSTSSENFCCFRFLVQFQGGLKKKKKEGLIEIQISYRLSNFKAKKDR